MVAPNDIIARKNEIADEIAAARVDEAIKRLIDFFRDFCPAKEEEAINISRRWMALKQKQIKYVLSHQDFELSTNQIVDAIFESLRLAMENIQETRDATPSLVGDRAQLEALLAEELRQRETPQEILLRITDLQKQYRSTGFHLTVEELQLKTGEITGLVGENATGKTTLFRIMAGDLAHDEGLLQYPLWQTGKGYNWVNIKEHIAYVPQEVPQWYGSLRENLKYEAALHGIKGEDNDKEVDYIIQRLGLGEHIHKSWLQLSGGYKLRFSLAKAFIKKPQLLILDEPLANLDIKTRVIVLNDLQNLCKSLRFPLGIMISSQHLEEIEAVADQMCYMRDGKLEVLGSTETFGTDRTHNTFELTSATTFKVIQQAMEGFPHQKIWYDGMRFFITTDLTISSFQLLQHLEAQQLEIQSFADISTSVKTKFYEAYL